MSTKKSRVLLGTLSMLSTVLLVAAIMAATGPDMMTRSLGAKIAFGKGSVSTYADFDESGNPSAVGIMFDLAGLESPPEGGSDLHHCFDRNGDGEIQRPDECNMTHEFVVPLPDKLARRDDVPFKWVLLNWNAMGHIPPGIYDTPHFDVHFMIDPIESIFSISSGACGPEFVNCEQFAKARKPLPANYVPEVFKDVGAVAPAMGNHMIDVTGPEFNGVPFTRSWIFGSYDGHITFYEEMLTIKYLMSKPDKCNAITSPEAVGLSGYYPTQSCVRYDPDKDAYTVSMESFQYREAQPPTAPRPQEPPPEAPAHN